MQRMIPITAPELVPLSREPLTINERFRANVRRIMRDQQVSQAELARRLEKLGKPCNRISFNQMMNHGGSPRMEWIELIARALECTELDLLSDADEYAG